MKRLILFLLPFCYIPFTFAGYELLDPHTDSIGGYITITGPDGAGIYHMEAFAKDGYHFYKWSDSVATASRDIDPADLTKDDHYFYAIFRHNSWNNTAVNLSTNNPLLGTVTTTEVSIDTCEHIYRLVANPQMGYFFDRWSDGVTTAIRYDSLYPGQVVNLTAQFISLCEFDVTASTENLQGGTVANTLNTENCTSILTATPNAGYIFLQWSDGDKTNPRYVDLEYAKDTTLTAIFGINPHLDATATHGTISWEPDLANCRYIYRAVPNTGYSFSGWNQNGTLQPYSANPLIVPLSSFVEDGDTINPFVQGETTNPFMLGSFSSTAIQILDWSTTGVRVMTNNQGITASLAAWMEGTACTVTPSGEIGIYTITIPSITAHAGEMLQIYVSDGNGSEDAITTYIPYILSGTVSTSSLTLNESSDVVITNGATLTQDDDNLTIRNLQLVDNATFVLPAGKTLTVASLAMQADGIQGRFPQMRIDGSLFNNNGDTLYYDYILNSAQYFPLAFPQTMSCADIRTRTGFTSPSFLSYTFDGLARYSTNDGWQEFDDTAVGAAYNANQGYIVYAARPKWNGTRQEFATLRFPVHIDLTNGDRDDKAIPVHQYGEPAERPGAANWNLLPNPYLCAIHLPNVSELQPGVIVGDDDNGYVVHNDGFRYVTISNNGFRSYEQLRVEDAIIHPFCSYFVQSAGEGTLTFQTTQRALAPRRAPQRTSKTEFPFTLLVQQGAETASTGFLLGAAFTTAYDFNADLSKMFGGSENLSLYSYAPADPKTALAFQALDEESAKQLALPIGIITGAKSGTMTVSVQHAADLTADFEAIYLIDNASGKVTNLLYENYTFAFNVSNIENRLAIQAICRAHDETPTSSPAVLNGTANASNGVYTVTGQRVGDAKTLSSRVRAGIYIVVTDNGVHKIVLP